MERKSGKDRNLSRNQNRKPEQKKIFDDQITKSRPTSNVSPKEKKFNPSHQRDKKYGNFMPLNATNVAIIQSTFENIQPELYNLLAKSDNYTLYQYEGEDYEIFLVSNALRKYVKKIVNTCPIQHVGVPLGYMRRKTTKTGFERAFYLSYEGGEFLFNYSRNVAPVIHGKLQKITLNDIGVKNFLYGGEIKPEHVKSDTSTLHKKDIIFVVNDQDLYLGLAILIVKQAGAVKPGDEQEKNTDFSSRSKNFTLSILTLTDAGHFIRDGI